MRPVWPYLAPALTALYLGNQKPAKKSHMGVYGPLRLMMELSEQSVTLAVASKAYGAALYRDSP
jgi:hypothetical protein